MELSFREIFGLIHGIVLGSIFLLSYGAAMVWLKSFQHQFLSDQGRIIRSKNMIPVVWTLTIICWLTVLSGTLITYPWYRAIPIEGVDLKLYPQALLASSKHTEHWHSFAMEWKEHIAWLSPFIFTTCAYIMTVYKEMISNKQYVRKALMLLLTLAFISAMIAGLLGALITKKAPIL